MEKKLKSVCFFLISGKTFTFRDVEIVHDNESSITIVYRAMSDGNFKEATFDKANGVVGVSRCE